MASDSRPTEGGDECIREKLDTRQDHELAVEVFDDAFIGSLGLRKAELGGPKERLSNWDEHTSHLDGNSPGASRMRQEQGANWESWELTSIHPHSKQDSRISVIGCRTLVLESNSDRCVVPLNARGRWRGSAARAPAGFGAVLLQEASRAVRWWHTSVSTQRESALRRRASAENRHARAQVRDDSADGPCSVRAGSRVPGTPCGAFS